MDQGFKNCKKQGGQNHRKTRWQQALHKNKQKTPQHYVSAQLLPPPFIILAPFRLLRTTRSSFETRQEWTMFFVVLSSGSSNHVPATPIRGSRPRSRQILTLARDVTAPCPLRSITKHLLWSLLWSKFVLPLRFFNKKKRGDFKDNHECTHCVRAGHELEEESARQKRKKRRLLSIFVSMCHSFTLVLNSTPKGWQDDRKCAVRSTKRHYWQTACSKQIECTGLYNTSYSLFKPKRR